MNTPERIEAVQEFGYDVDESRFLEPAALHSGYFLRRQFLAFVRGTKGWKDVVFLKKLKSNGHCRVTFFRHSRMVYHLSSKPLYEALGEKDSRRRREHQPSTIKNRIMGLDYVLEHPHYRYLATEREKLEYFLHTRNVAPEHLPTRLYSSPRGHDPTAKHFVESYPIYLPMDGAGAQACFCYIDEGLQTTDRFATYLTQYGRLFNALGDFHVIYIAERPRLFASAERIFQRFVASSLSGSAEREDTQQEQLATYFQRRRRYENQDFSDFDTSTLIQLREERKRFAGEPYETLYTQWKAGSLAALNDTACTGGICGERVQRQFSTCILEHDYDLFGTLTTDRDKRTTSEIETQP